MWRLVGFKTPALALAGSTDRNRRVRGGARGVVADVLDSIPPEMCVRCKAARSLCGIDPCPLLQRVRGHLPKVQLPGRDLFGSSPPSLFVGRHGYPRVNVGPMLPAEHLSEELARNLDAPRRWINELGVPDVVGLRSSLVRTTHSVKVADAARNPDRITRLSQELAVAARPVDTEVHLRRMPSFSVAHVGTFTAPHGPVVELDRAQLTENVRVENPVERATSDTDLRASSAVVQMFDQGVDPYQMERILSAGMLGLERGRRLVPTRWAITATDDTLGKSLIPRVLDLPTIDKPTVHFAERFGNRFHILLLPRLWGFEIVESWQKGSFWAQGREHAPADTSPAAPPAVDWEDHRGRTEYAHNVTGGYYAARLPVLEHMLATRKQATAIVLREISDEYTTPLGVWVVREAARCALESKPLVFEDTESALRHMDRRARLKDWRRHAEFLPQVLRQRTLESF